MNANSQIAASKRPTPAGTALLVMTVVGPLVVLAASFYELSLAKKDDFWVYAIDAIIMFGGGFFLILFGFNLAFFIAQKNARGFYAAGCLILVLACWSVVVLGRKIDAERDAWFIKKGIVEYDRYVSLVASNQGKLSQKAVLVNFSASPPYGRNEVMASTNSDGSLFVMFIDRDNDPHAGYVYYSGQRVRTVPGNPNLYYLDDSARAFQKITNFWYKY
jgi:hypothetical protein